MTPRVKPASSESKQRSGSRAGRILDAFTSRVADGAKGAGAGRSRRPRRGVAVVVVALALMVGLATQLVPAFASSPPSVGAELYYEAVGSTRAYIAALLNAGGNVEMSWRGEYATSEALLNEGKGIVAAIGHSERVPSTGVFPQQEIIGLGARDAAVEVGGVLHHLQPSTSYYARFCVENKAKETACRTFSFITLPAAAPEVAHSLAEKEEIASFTGATTFHFGGFSRTSAVARAQVESNGASTSYVFEYAPGEGGHVPSEVSSAWKPFTTGGNGTVSAAEDFAEVESTLAGLAPETAYYVRLKLHNEHGSVVEHRTAESKEGLYETLTAKPIVQGAPVVRNVTPESAYLTGSMDPSGEEMEWQFESAESPGGPWVAVPTAAGTVSQAEAEAPDASFGIEGPLAGLKPNTTYYVRLSAKNEAGAAPAGSVASFHTSGAPIAATLAVHGVDGEALRLLGAVNPNSKPTSSEQRVTVEGAATGGSFTLTFDGQTTAPIPLGASRETVRQALVVLSTIPGKAEDVDVTGRDGGPYTIFFEGSLAGVEQPVLGSDGSGLTPGGSGSVAVAVLAKGGEASDTHYHFQYVPQRRFEAESFTHAAVTPEVDVGAGGSPDYVGADLPPLTAGESYRFRIVATNTSPGDPVVDGEAQTLTVPPAVASAPEASGACPNEALRRGPSALLPDCRAYEQVTPVEKDATQELYNYGAHVNEEGAVVGEDGDHLEYGSSFVKFGDTAGSGQSPYFFSRRETGWQMMAGAPQPEAGIDNYQPELFNPDLTEFGFESLFQTSGTSRSPEVEFRAGPPGGPYATVATVSRKAAEGGGWVAASEDFSKMVLQLEDPTLLGASTHTQSGDPDLYEYSVGGLRHVNVTGTGAAIGTCGATIARGAEGIAGEKASGSFPDGSRHAVSGDGSRVFFEAVPGSDCSQPKHLYVRIDGGGEHPETVDLGAYRLVAANAAGTTVLLLQQTGANPGLYLYQQGAGIPEFLPSTGPVAALAAPTNGRLGYPQFTISQDLSTIYFMVGNPEFPENASAYQDLYQYNIPSKSLSLVAHLRGNLSGKEKESAEADTPNLNSVSPDGRYLYFTAGGVRGLPGGGQVLETPNASQNGQSRQAYRFDREQALVQCVSCASSFDPEPREDALFAPEAGSEGANFTAQGMPRDAVASANGNYVFFDTPAALVPSDVDGEITPEINNNGAGHGIHNSPNFSVSSDVYEWRGYGVNGCTHLQGCIALITSGGGGFMNVLIGSADEGRDVFFATKESLLPSDDDSVEDIYDARIDGGFAEPARPVECAGDACSSPFAPPGEVTPSSSTFQGPGNAAPAVAAPVVKKKTVAKKKPKKSHRKKHKKPARKAKKSSKGRK